MAQAERYGRDLGWFVEWSNDPEDCGCEDGDDHASFGAVLWDNDRLRVLGSLGAICAPDGNYRRVIEAALMYDAMYA